VTTGQLSSDPQSFIAAGSDNALRRGGRRAAILPAIRFPIIRDYRVILALCALAAACGGPSASSVAADRRGQVDGQAFELSTGGTGFLETHGQWMVRVRGDAMWVSQTMGAKSKEFGTYQLSRGETQKLWTLVESAKLHQRPEVGVNNPETPVFSFTILRPKKLAHTVTLSMNATGNDDRLVELVEFVESLARKYTKRKAVIVPVD
jgi:hypothetical protein